MSLAIGMTKSGRGTAGSALFIEGMSSLLDPMFITDRNYRTGFNVLNRGGTIRTRPGYSTIYTLPDGTLQGLWYFRPLHAEAYLVFAVAGKVYTSQYPFNSYTQLSNITFHPYAPQLFAESAVQSARTLSDGTVEAVEPTRVLVMQDGMRTKAAFWNGANSGHLDPGGQATAEATLSGAGVDKVYVTFGGSGYSTPPRVVFSEPETMGSLPQAYAVLTAGEVTGIVVTQPGGGYAEPPTVYLTDASVVSTDPNFNVSNKYQTPIGGPMVWSGDRLWVASNNRVYASDISNPLSFIENIYAAEGGFFEFTEPVTALAEVPHPTNPFVAIFTDTSTSAIQSSVRTRSSWKLTPSFQNTIFPGVGCVSQRSVVKPLGELWWMSPFGLVSFASAAQASNASKLVPQDTKMLSSKCNLNPDLSSTAVGVYENFLLVSVPYADKYNQHTWVYDQASQSDDATAASSASWAGTWTGTRPVQWATGVFGGVQRSFFVSKDYDGKNRLWEAFTSSRLDNGERINCLVETKTHNEFGDARVSGLDRKKFALGEATLSDLQGTVDCIVRWAGTRGKYKEIATDVLQADRGSLVAGVSFSRVSTYNAQQRVLRTREVVQDSDADCSSLGVESPFSDFVDVGFSLLLEWDGPAAIRSYRIWVDLIDESSTGESDRVETKPKVLEGSICQ